jgi:D-amino-acid dehydrogenase
MSKRVVIIGAGVIGLCSAYYCARRGFAVTVIERKPVQRDGTSFGNAGMIVPSHFIPLAAPGMVALGLKWMWNPASPFYVKPRLDADLLDWGWKFWRAANAEHVRRSAPLIRDLSLASRACFEEFAALPDTDFGLVKKGLLMLCQSEHALQEEAKMAEQARALGVPAEVLDAKQTAVLDPGARLDIAGSIYFPLDCHLTTERFMAALQSQTERLGVKFIWESEVLDAKLSNTRRVQAITVPGGEEIEADEFVLCGGSWSPELARKFALPISLQAGKGYSLTLTKPRQLPQICSICTEARVAVTPMGEKLRVGGTMEIAGLNEDINPVRVRGIIDSFCRYFPDFRAADFDGIQPWRGLRPCSPDGLPYIGRTSKFSNFSIATGHGMMGLSLGPVTGRLMAEVLSGEKPAWDIGPLSPDRYN